MEELELECEKGILIGKIFNIYGSCNIYTKLANFFGIADDFNVVGQFMKTKTIDELIDIVEELSKQHKWAENYSCDRVRDVIDSINKINKIRNKTNKTNIEKDIAIIKDNVQNTADIVNLFTDIDKNRTSTDDRIDKLEQKITQLESSISQLVNMLQKS